MGEDTVYVSSDIILQTLPSPGTGRMGWSHCVVYSLYYLRICEQGCVYASTKVFFPQRQSEEYVHE